MTNQTTDIIKLNIGPQHPSTHGVLRLITTLDGENVLNIEPVVGYLHRGIEKMAENRSFLQYLPIVDRIDYLGGFFNSYAYCDAVENLSSIEVPLRAKYIRVLLMEMNRIASHLLWLGSYLLDLGATSPLFYTFREREILLKLFEDLTGQRMMYNYFIFGGVRFDVENAWLDRVLDFAKLLPKKIKDYENIITNNPIFSKRVCKKGIISKNLALQYSITGANLRASGVDFDYRKSNPYLIYDKLDFDTIVDKGEDSFARYKVRIAEMELSLSLIEQVVSWLKSNSGAVSTSINAVNLTIPDGEHTSYVEAPRGVTFCYLKSIGDKKPYRVKWRTGSYYAVQILPELLKNMKYPDLMAIFGSLDIILPEVDK